MVDARTWVLVFRTLGVIFTALAALAGVGYLLADRSVQWGRRLSPSQIESLTEELKTVAKLQICPAEIPASGTFPLADKKRCSIIGGSKP